jgi:hypothetical protein
MQTNEDIRAEGQLVGKWVGTEGTQRLEYEFEPQHRFKVKIVEGDGESSCAWGYWDVLNGQLRLGTSAEECDGMPISVGEAEFTLGDPARGPTTYSRQST